MDKNNFIAACKNEKNAKVKTRMLAVNMVRNEDHTIVDTAKFLMQNIQWVNRWLTCFGQDGIDRLRNLPKEGRPPLISREDMYGMIVEATKMPVFTPKIFRKFIHDKTGVCLHITHVRWILHSHDMTPKKPQPVHVRRASKKTCRNWQYRMKSIISGVKNTKTTLMYEDDAGSSLIRTELSRYGPRKERRKLSLTPATMKK